MIVLTTDTAAQTFNCIPRGYFDTLELTDEQTNVTEQITIVSSTVGDYVNSIEAEFNLVEGHFYTLVLKDGTDIMYKDKVFCTDQNIVTFSVNDGQYVSNTTANTFIVYE